MTNETIETVRVITDHAVDPATEKLTIDALDAPGAGGASHLYRIERFDSASNPSAPWTARHGQSARHSTILFQNGPIPEVGVNGVTIEALLAIVADRLRGFQGGPAACEENHYALCHVEQALVALKDRTLSRLRRGVEGTHAV